MIAEETITRGAWGRTRTTTERVHRDRVVLGRDLRARPDTPARGEGTFEVPAQVGEGEGLLRWRVEVRTRLFGPDYSTLFPIAMADDED